MSVSRNFNDGHETQGQYFTPLANGEWEKKVERREALSEVGYNLLKQGVRNWIEQDLQWKREEIISYYIKYELIEDGYKEDENKKKWAKWKHGKNVEVTIMKINQEKQFAHFIKLDDGDWELKKVDNA